MLKVQAKTKKGTREVRTRVWVRANNPGEETADTEKETEREQEEDTEAPEYPKEQEPESKEQEQEQEDVPEGHLHFRTGTTTGISSLV